MVSDENGVVILGSVADWKFTTLRPLDDAFARPRLGCGVVGGSPAVAGLPAARVGGVSGFMHFLANTSGIIGPTLTGFLVQFTGSFTSAFLLAGVLTIIGAVCVARYVKPLPVIDEAVPPAGSVLPAAALSHP